MKIERELMRGAGPVAVLRLLERQERYGYELVESLSKQSGGVLAMGQSTLYPLLYNLQAKGLIEGQWREAESGRRRKYYSITDRGRKRLAKERRQWKALSEAMSQIGVLGSSNLGEATS